ncbi:hypothetical protein BOTBODRAFT_119606 [Botryobasidium botryosum FD-172 SS1]|uniref:Peptidase M43 pregnancy-associated plasma-A domain-containing protein n=1 Tax=Botryobasidium botryosum (strain FD-172 SS1) TaxID=930990 RepID=A0A067LX06_BOTB1|nr:hypothetical protein BOTBODRAFT_119606 [Botryobasidium botryosum FD-172 SS1]
MNTTIQVYWHVITANGTVAGGNVSDSQIASNIDVVNKDYARSGISWKLAGTTRTQNSAWFNNVAPDDFEQTDMKTKLRKGDAKTLNVYTVGFTTGSAKGLLGYSTFPMSYKDAPLDDGVVILFSSLPGGSTSGFNLGKTLTHEVGHWVGLYHTFEGGCNTPGDYVDDTPYEASPASGCPTGRDTCTGTNGEGVDPSALLSSSMDYSVDSCMTEFTAGQLARMNAQVSQYRF